MNKRTKLFIPILIFSVVIIGVGMTNVIFSDVPHGYIETKGRNIRHVDGRKYEYEYTVNGKTYVTITDCNYGGTSVYAGCVVDSPNGERIAYNPANPTEAIHLRFNGGRENGYGTIVFGFVFLAFFWWLIMRKIRFVS